MKEVTEVWKSIEEELTEVQEEDRKSNILREDETALSKSTLQNQNLHLLPSFDVFLLAHAEKSHMLHDRHYKRIYRNQGWISPVMLLDGRVIGTWTHERKGKFLEITVEPFDKIPKSLSAQIESEAQRLSTFLGATYKLILP